MGGKIRVDRQAHQPSKLEMAAVMCFSIHSRESLLWTYIKFVQCRKRLEQHEIYTILMIRPGGGMVTRRIANPKIGKTIWEFDSLPGLQTILGA